MKSINRQKYKILIHQLLGKYSLQPSNLLFIVTHSQVPLNAVKNVVVFQLNS